jgi:hypothetical protein
VVLLGAIAGGLGKSPRVAPRRCALRRRAPRRARDAPPARRSSVLFSLCSVLLRTRPSCRGCAEQVEEGAGAGRPHPCAPWPWPRRPVSCACSRASPPTVLGCAGLEPCTCVCRSVRANDPIGRTPARPGLRPHRVNAPRAGRRRRAARRGERAADQPANRGRACECRERGGGPEAPTPCLGALPPPAGRLRRRPAWRAPEEQGISPGRGKGKERGAGPVSRTFRAVRPVGPLWEPGRLERGPN